MQQPSRPFSHTPDLPPQVLSNPTFVPLALPCFSEWNMKCLS